MVLKISSPVKMLFPSVIVLVLFYVLPISYNVIASFSPAVAVDISGIKAYLKIFTDFYYLQVLTQTMLLGAVVALMSVILGYPIAYYLARMRSSHKSVVTFLIISPLLISLVIRSYGWMLILGKSGLVNSILTSLGVITDPLQLIYNWTGVLIAIIHVILPYVILSLSSVIEGINPAIEDSARVLGANRYKTFLRITLPMSVQGIATGATLAFLLTIGSFVTVLMLGGKGTMVLSLLIYQQITITFNEAFAAALSTSLMAIAIVFLLIQLKLLRRWI